MLTTVTATLPWAQTEEEAGITIASAASRPTQGFAFFALGNCGVARSRDSECRKNVIAPSTLPDEPLDPVDLVRGMKVTRVERSEIFVGCRQPSHSFSAEKPGSFLAFAKLRRAFPHDVSAAGK